MLVSRSGDKLRRAVDSIALQEPDEFRAYMDPHADNQHDIQKVLKDANAHVLMQHPHLAANNHENYVHNVHRAMLEAEHPWIIKFDDDDEMLGSQRKELIWLYGHSNVGIIHGDKVVDYPFLQYLRTRQFLQFAKSLVKPTLFLGAPVSSYRDVRFKIWARTTIIDTKAFRQIHPLLDHGYFCDWKMFYWILRRGWQAVYVPEILLRQTVNAHASPERKRFWGKWTEIMDEMEHEAVLEERGLAASTLPG